MSSIFFLSDAHLGSEEKSTGRRREELLLDFLNYVETKGERLYIVGDLFDFWFEYRSVIPRRYFDTLYTLKKLVNRGLEVGYVIGNHDYWMDSFFQDQLGIRVYRDTLEIMIDGKHLFVAHGDGLAKNDVGYRILKRVLRYPLNIRLFRFLHPAIGFALAGFFSKLSRNCREVKNRDAEYIQYAEELFAEGFDCVVLGHTHRPQEYRKDGRVYINTGDWMNHFTYGKLEKGRLSLEYWTKEAVSVTKLKEGQRPSLPKFGEKQKLNP